MNVFKNTGEELRRLFGGVVGKLIILSLLIIPILYGALYLWAFLDPYDNIDKLPVALVNNDKPYTTQDGTTISGGQDLVDELLETKTFNWKLVSSEEAKKGMDENKYFLTMYIPSNFSQSIGTASSDDPVPAMLYARADVSNNFLTSQIGSRVFLEIQSKTSASVSETFYKEIFKSFETSRSSLTKAKDGAFTLHSGLQTAVDGSGDLADGLQTASSGADQLKEGSSQLSSGLRQLDEGGKTLASSTGELASKSKQLQSGASKLASGSQTLSTSLPELVDGAEQVDAGVGQLQSKMDEASAGAESLATGAAGNKQYVDTLAGMVQQLLSTDGSQLPASQKQAMLTAAGTAQVVAGKVDDGASQLSSSLTAAKPAVSQLKAGTAKLSAGAKAASSGASEIAAGASQLDAGTTKLVDGASKLDAGAQKVSSSIGAASQGAVKLDKGVGELQAGTVKLADGALRLHSGLKPAVSGTLTLANGLEDGIKDIPDFTQAQQEANAKMMSNPVELDEKNVGETNNYGSGFAPYFLPLALWVGALIGYLFIDPLPGKRDKRRFTTPIARAISGYVPMAILSLAQTLILALVIEKGLHINPVRSLWFWAMLLACSMCYTAILQWLNSSFGPAGKLFAIIFLMLQLTSASGTFPTVLQSGFFQAMHPYMPMTYIVAGLREAMAGGMTSVIVHNLVVVVSIGAGAFVLTIVAAGTRISDVAGRLSKKVGL